MCAWEELLTSRQERRSGDYGFPTVTDWSHLGSPKEKNKQVHSANLPAHLGPQQCDLEREEAWLRTRTEDDGDELLQSGWTHGSVINQELHGCAHKGRDAAWL
jgi:hypothetical protein